MQQSQRGLVKEKKQKIEKKYNSCKLLGNDTGNRSKKMTNKKSLDQ